MNKITLIFAILFSAVMSAQFSEDFESGVPGSMSETFLNGSVAWSDCGGTLGGATCPISGGSSAAFFNGSFTNFETALDTPVIDLSGDSYRLLFKHLVRNWSGDINELFVEISTDGGTTFTTMEHYNYDIQEFTTHSIDLDAYSPTASTIIRFRAVNYYSYSLLLDDIEIVEIPDTDLAMTSFDIDAISEVDMISIEGDFVNNGLNTVNSVDLNWQVDGGTTYTETLSGLDLEAGGIYAYSHSDVWDATVGEHEVSVWVSNVNGAGDDDDISNDGISKTVSIASGTVSRTPLYEEFTSSTCGPCATFNLNHFTDTYLTNNEGDYSLIKYQMNWPGAGDPYYTAQGGTRRAFYGVNAVPTLVLDGQESTPFSTTALQNALNNAKDVPAFFSMSNTKSVSGTVVESTVEVMPYLDGEFTLHVVVVEKQTESNATSNGETTFKNVMMTMTPNANGTAVTFVHDTPYTETFSVDMAGTFVEDIEDLEVVAFIQNNATKEVMQSTYDSLELGTEDIGTELTGIVIYPNPSKGTFKVSTYEPVNISIVDVLGKTVYTQYNVNSDQSISVESLKSGVYFVQVENDGASTTKKLIIK